MAALSGLNGLLVNSLGTSYVLPLGVHGSCSVCCGGQDTSCPQLLHLWSSSCWSLSVGWCCLLASFHSQISWQQNGSFAWLQWLWFPTLSQREAVSLFAFCVGVLGDSAFGHFAGLLYGCLTMCEDLRVISIFKRGNLLKQFMVKTCSTWVCEPFDLDWGKNFSQNRHVHSQSKSWQCLWGIENSSGCYWHRFFMVFHSDPVGSFRKANLNISYWRRKTRWWSLYTNMCTILCLWPWKLSVWLRTSTVACLTWDPLLETHYSYLELSLHRKNCQSNLDTVLHHMYRIVCSRL